MPRLWGVQSESLWDEVLPGEARELPEDQALIRRRTPDAFRCLGAYRARTSQGTDLCGFGTSRHRRTRSNRLGRGRVTRW